jgi:hypothetical protein
MNFQRLHINWSISVCYTIYHIKDDISATLNDVFKCIDSDWRVDGDVEHEITVPDSYVAEGALTYVSER